MQRVTGINPELLRKIPRIVGIAGGPRKTSAMHAALLGGWTNALITDRTTAETLLSEESHLPTRQPRESRRNR